MSMLLPRSPSYLVGVRVRVSVRVSVRAGVRVRAGARVRSPSYPSVSSSQKMAYIESKTSGNVSGSSFCRMPPRMSVATRMANIGTKIGRDERLTAMMSTRQPE